VFSGDYLSNVLNGPCSLVFFIINDKWGSRGAAGEDCEQDVTGESCKADRTVDFELLGIKTFQQKPL